jgi:hypothetical protein
MTRPNFIFIVADDLGYADLGCCGGRPAAFGPVSPVLDSLAAQGLLFSEGYTRLAGVLAHALCDDDRALAVPAARRCRRTDHQPQPGQQRARPARDPHPPLAAEGGGLPHRAVRQVAPGLSAALRSAALRLRGILRPDVRRRRLLHPLQQRRTSRPVHRGGGEARGRLPDRHDLPACGRLRRSPWPRRRSRARPS